MGYQNMVDNAERSDIFTPHVTKIAARAKDCLQALKTLAGTTWCQDNNNNKLKRIRNQALRIATGSALKSDIQHLHSETKELPLSNHLTIFYTQFLASALRSIHPSYALVT